MNLLTFHDVATHLNDFMGKATIGTSVVDAKRATLQAVRELANIHDWRYLIREHIVRTEAAYSTGTIAYDHTGGSSERLVTLTTGTWPSWAAQGKLLIGGNTPAYEVASRIDDTTITLSVASNPGSDVASGTTYSLYQDSYPLPSDFVKFRSRVLDAANKYFIPYVPPRKWLSLTTAFSGATDVFEFTVMPSPDYLGADAITFSPPPATSKAYSFLYQRRPRDLKVFDETTGTVAVTNGSTTVTGTSTAFTSSMVGSVFRLGDSATAAPTAIEGDRPFVFERIITAVASATSLTLDVASDRSDSGKKYRISDPIDIQHGVMQNALLRLAEKQVANFRSHDRKIDYIGIAQQAVIAAIEADNRSGAALESAYRACGGMTELVLERGVVPEPS